MVDERYDEETLDPTDWDQLTVLGHEMLDFMMEYLRTIRSQPFSAPTEESVSRLMEPISELGEGEEKMFEIFKNSILP